MLQRHTHTQWYSLYFDFFPLSACSYLLFRILTELLSACPSGFLLVIFGKERVICLLHPSKVYHLHTEVLCHNGRGCLASAQTPNRLWTLYLPFGLIITFLSPLFSPSGSSVTISSDFPVSCIFLHNLNTFVFIIYWKVVSNHPPNFQLGFPGCKFGSCQ